MHMEALDKFGRLLIERVRDKAILEWEMIVDGRMKGEFAEHERELLRSFDDAHRGAFLCLVPRVVDTVLHHLLWTLEQREDVDIGVRIDDGYVRSLRDVSDGLAGELYSADGWVGRFSSRRGGRGA